MDENDLAIYNEYASRHPMTPEEALGLVTDSWPDFLLIAEWWDSLPLLISTTSVGTAIAHANWKRVAGGTTALSVWITPE